MKNKRGWIAQLMGAFITIAIGFMIFPMVWEQVQAAQNSQPAPDPWISAGANVTPIFFGLGIIGVALAALIPVLRGFDDSSNSEPEPEQEIPQQPAKSRKQTYLEYVKERLEVERLMRRWW